jgi:hypothetical protein
LAQIPPPTAHLSYNSTARLLLAVSSVRGAAVIVVVRVPAERCRQSRLILHQTLPDVLPLLSVSWRCIVRAVRTAMLAQKSTNRLAACAPM